MVGIPPESLCDPDLYFSNQFRTIGLRGKDAQGRAVRHSLEELRQMAQDKLASAKQYPFGYLSNSANTPKDADAQKARERRIERLILFLSGRCYCKCELNDVLEDEQILEFFYRNQEDDEVYPKTVGERTFDESAILAAKAHHERLQKQISKAGEPVPRQQTEESTQPADGRGGSSKNKAVSKRKAEDHPDDADDDFAWREASKQLATLPRKR